MPGCRRPAAVLGRKAMGVSDDIDRTPPCPVASIQAGTPVSRQATGRMPLRIERPADTGENGPPAKPVNRTGWSRESASRGAIARTAAQNTDAAAAIASRGLTLRVMLIAGSAA